MLLSITPTEEVIAAIMQDTGFEISPRVMKQMARAERKPVLQKRKFLKITSSADIQRGSCIVTDCLWLPARQLVCYAANMADEQGAGDGPFSDKPTFLPSNEFMLEIRVMNGKWTMRDRGFGELPMSASLLVPLREVKL